MIRGQRAAPALRKSLTEKFGEIDSFDELVLKERDLTIEILRLDLHNPRMIKISDKTKFVMKCEEAVSIKWSLTKLEGGGLPHAVAMPFPDFSKTATAVV